MALDPEERTLSIEVDVNADEMIISQYCACMDSRDRWIDG